jgi:hypothetical protein
MLGLFHGGRSLGGWIGLERQDRTPESVAERVTVVGREPATDGDPSA